MIKLNKKVIVAAILAILTIALCVTPVFAVPIGGVDVQIDTANANALNGTGAIVLGYIRVVGTFISVGVLMFLGIKYMTASASEKADVKKSIIPYIIGATVLLLASNIVPLIVDFGGQLFNGSTTQQQTQQTQQKQQKTN